MEYEASATDVTNTSPPPGSRFLDLYNQDSGLEEITTCSGLCGGGGGGGIGWGNKACWACLSVNR